MINNLIIIDLLKKNFFLIIKVKTLWQKTWHLNAIKTGVLMPYFFE